MRATWLESSDAISSEDLKAQGILHEVLPLEPSAHQPALDALRERQGYSTQDEIALEPETENLEAICDKFKDEHLHTDDEVRFVLSGEGVFDIRSNDDRWMRVEVGAGDLIVVPKDRYHRFFLTDAKSIRCVRLFQDPAGWTPLYRDPS